MMDGEEMVMGSVDKSELEVILCSVILIVSSLLDTVDGGHTLLNPISCLWQLPLLHHLDAMP